MMRKKSIRLLGPVCSLLLLMAGCSEETGVNPDTAPEVSVDRFSAAAGNLMVRDAMNGLPGPNAPVNFDMAPFITKGLGPAGQMVEYYNFDVQSSTPAPIYVLFREGETTPVADQLNIIDVIPGDAGYSDFWRVYTVTVPGDYIANTITSYAGLSAAGYPINSTTSLVNCPVVPKGSTATKRLGGGNTALERGWYKSQVVYYFTFTEKDITIDGAGLAPVSPIYVTFNINPDQPGGGPPSGFVTEMSSDQTHNVIATVPADASYSPLWSVSVYDNADFSSVSNLASALSANILASNIATVNCPVVAVQ